MMQQTKREVMEVHKAGGAFEVPLWRAANYTTTFLVHPHKEILPTSTRPFVIARIVQAGGAWEDDNSQVSLLNMCCLHRTHHMIAQPSVLRVMRSAPSDPSLTRTPFTVYQLPATGSPPPAAPAPPLALLRRRLLPAPPPSP